MKMQSEGELSIETNSLRFIERKGDNGRVYRILQQLHSVKDLKSGIERTEWRDVKVRRDEDG